MLYLPLRTLRKMSMRGIKYDGRGLLQRYMKLLKVSRTMLGIITLLSGTGTLSRLVASERKELTVLV